MTTNEDRRLTAERRLAAQADRVIVPVVAERDHLLNVYQAPPGNIRIIPCGIDLNLFAPVPRQAARHRLKLPATCELVLFVGRFAPLKRLDRLVAATAQLRRDHPALRLLLVGGDDPDADSVRAVQAQIRRLGLETVVHLAGRVTHSELPAYYGAADLLALPSDYESFGLVLLEALACGIPIVAAPVGAAPELVQEGRNGTLLADNMTATLAAGIARLLAPNVRSAAAIRASVAAYNWPHIAAALADVYVDLVARRRTAGGVPRPGRQPLSSAKPKGSETT